MPVTTQPSPDKRGGAALCCQCGNLRTCPTGKLRTRKSDPDRTSEVDSDPRGWRMTGTLPCPVCEISTVHAILNGGAIKDRAEEFLYKRASWMHGTG